MGFGAGGSSGPDGVDAFGTGAGDDVDRPDYASIAWLLVSAPGLAACITLLFLGMRAVFDIGGACASGGPFVSVQPCPDAVPASMTVGVLGLFAFGGLGVWAGARVGGAWAGLPLLAWPGLFLGLGWNFLEYGMRPPGDDTGPALGWLFSGLVFIVMGAVPLWIGISARNELRSGGGHAVVNRFGLQDRARRHAARSAGARTPAGPASPASRPTSARPATEPSTETDADLVARLERLADLRRGGDLTTEEFEAAKARLLGGDR